MKSLPVWHLYEFSSLRRNSSVQLQNAKIHQLLAWTNFYGDTSNISSRINYTWKESSILLMLILNYVIGLLISKCQWPLSYQNQIKYYMIPQSCLGQLSFLIPWENSSRKSLVKGYNFMYSQTISSIRVNWTASNLRPPLMLILHSLILFVWDGSEICQPVLLLLIYLNFSLLWEGIHQFNCKMQKFISS